MIFFNKNVELPNSHSSLLISSFANELFVWTAKILWFLDSKKDIILSNKYES